MGPISGIFSARPNISRDPKVAAHEAGISLESALLSKLLSESVGKMGDGPEARFASDVFAQVVAEAVARSGGVGIAKSVENSLAGVVQGEGAPRSPSLRAVEHVSPVGLRSPVRPTLSSPHGHAHEHAGHEGPGAPVADQALSTLLVEGRARVSSAYGARRDPIAGHTRFHHGVDVAAPEGAGIRAAREGVVTFAGERRGYGKVIEIDHGDGMSTLYAHASALNAKAGDHVNEGDIIAEVGSTGRSTGPHLHFEVRHADRAVDPRAALKEGMRRADDLHNGRVSLRPQAEKLSP